MRLSWSVDSENPELTGGVDHGVIYPQNAPGVAWNGLISVEEADGTSDAVVMYVDGEKYLQKRAPGSFAAQISAYGEPLIFDNSIFYGFSYRSNQDLHLVYNATIEWASIQRDSLSDESEPSIFIWNVTTRPAETPGMFPSSHVILDLSRTYPQAVSYIEDILYGTDSSEPRLPLILEILDIYESAGMFQVVDNGDGTWTATGPADMIEMLDPVTFQITSPSAVYIDEDTYKLSSW